MSARHRVDGTPFPAAIRAIAPGRAPMRATGVYPSLASRPASMLASLLALATACTLPLPALAQAPSSPTAAAPSAPGTETAPQLFDRIGLIGASATAGYGVRVDALGEDGKSREIHGADFGDVMRAACRRPVTLSRYASMFFFNDPLSTGRSAVDRVLRFKPTCVLALDFLFWYGYGTFNAEGGQLRSEDDRLALLEVGLAQLDRVASTGVPIVVGDFPDMHEAVGKELSARQMPAAETLTRLNARLTEWASSRPNVRVLPLSTLAPALDRGDAIEIHGRTWSKSADGALLQRDRLHPTFVGSMAMLAKACELAELCARSKPADGDAGSHSTPTAPTAIVACDERMCFEPAELTQRFLQQVRAGRRRSDPEAGPTGKSPPVPPAPPDRAAPPAPPPPPPPPLPSDPAPG